MYPTHRVSVLVLPLKGANVLTFDYFLGPFVLSGHQSKDEVNENSQVSEIGRIFTQWTSQIVT